MPTWEVLARLKAPRLEGTNGLTDPKPLDPGS